MTDDLHTLKAALQDSPAPPGDARARALTLAMENFDRHQALGSGPRSNPDRPSEAGFWHKVRKMVSPLMSRPILAATASAAALCVGLIVILPLTGGQTLPPQPQKPLAVAPATQPPVPPAAQPADQPMAQPAAQAPAQASALADAESAAPATAPMGKSAPAFALSGTRSRSIMARPDAALALPAPAPTEAFATAPANPVRVTAEDPVSTFSVDVDTASYAIVRAMLTAGQLPPPDAVRVEEFINAFPYAYPAPAAADGPFRADVAVLPTPWNAQTRLVRIALQGALPALQDRPPLNLVFLIDTSGSMQDANKLPLLKQSLRLMLPQLTPQDQVAIVAYAGAAGEVLPPTAASDTAAIGLALDQLAPQGGTAGAEGLQLAYQIAATMAAPGEVSRVLLATDGDFNIGIADPEALKTLIARHRDAGTYLSVLGFGRGNLDDATMQALAQTGNGTAAYIDTLSEARKVLVDQLSGALFPIADDAKIQIEWNPAQVAEYRLIGYETRALRREDFRNDRVDAGEIGAGHQVTALYEITAPGSPALLNDPLRYGTTAPVAQTGSELGTLRLRAKLPGQDTSALTEIPILPNQSHGDDDARFAAAIAGFGQLLSGSVYLNGWGWDQAIALAEGARGEDPFGYRIEAVNLMRLAKALAAPN